MAITSEAMDKLTLLCLNHSEPGNQRWLKSSQIRWAFCISKSTNGPMATVLRSPACGSIRQHSRRTQDLEDIKALIATNRLEPKMDEVREYFRLFNRESLLEEI